MGGKEILKLSTVLFKVGTKAYMAARGERLKAQQIQKQREHELALEEKRIQVRLQEAKENRLLQENLTMRRIQSDKELAIYNARMQKELSADQAERGFMLDNFPLYVRKWSSKGALEKTDFLPVKVVMVSPSGSENHYCRGYEYLLEAAVTRFLQEQLPGNYYEFLGGAWRSDQYRGQAAYKLIYDEFYDEPFLIVEYSFTRDTYANLRICFWYPGSDTYHTVQLIENWDIRGFLEISARKRHNGADHLENAQDDYDACLRLLADIGAVIAGTFIDTYQLFEGVSSQPLVLRELFHITSLFSDNGVQLIRQTVAQWVVSEYQCLAESGLLNSRTEVSCMAALSELLLELPELRMRRKAIDFMKRSWSLWCTSYGIRPEELEELLEDSQDTREFLEMIHGDENSMEDLRRIYSLYQRTMQLARNPGLMSVARLTNSEGKFLQDKGFEVKDG